MPLIGKKKLESNGDLGDFNHTDYITPLLRGMALPIDKLIPDPSNARLHPEGNKEAIKESLRRFGQLKPVVVHYPDMIVLAGNGTLEAAKELGWKHLAAVKVEMNQADAVGYSIADNRTSELGKWDWERLQTAEKFVRENGSDIIGFDGTDLDILRSSEFVPPALDENTGEFEAGSMTICFLAGDVPQVKESIRLLKEMLPPREAKGLTDAQAISYICYLWKEAEEEIDRLRELARGAMEEFRKADQGLTWQALS